MRLSFLYEIKDQIKDRFINQIKTNLEADFKDKKVFWASVLVMFLILCAGWIVHFLAKWQFNQVNLY